ncbi:MAG TPA: sigma-70 family RNA polymerase sigma factor [Thermoanaerobaculia bacterium]|nr:sigma-70 family RNA polymerase sigma factor [Thermoanaerobaculia bacterium]HXK67922.1 sigma-70 family RNA polymerase sigma factor [Thermoanaerobaculia bacterium]
MKTRTLQSAQKEEFEERILNYVDILYSTALRLTRNPQDAQDLVQETSLRAFRYRHRFQDGTNFKAWLFTILRNTFINEYRRRRRIPDLVDLEDVKDFLSSGDTPEERALHGTLPDSVHQAFLTLPEDYRFVVILADLEGLTYREIAGILGVPMGTVMSRLYRGRKMLEQVLFDYGRSRGYLKDVRPERIRNQDLLAECA